MLIGEPGFVLGVAARGEDVRLGASLGALPLFLALTCISRENCL